MRFICSIRWRYNRTRRCFVAGVYNSVWRLCYSLHDEGIDSVSRRQKDVFLQMFRPYLGPTQTFFRGTRDCIPGDMAAWAWSSVSSLQCAFMAHTWTTRVLGDVHSTFKVLRFFGYPRQFIFIRSYPRATH